MARSEAIQVVHDDGLDHVIKECCLPDGRNCDNDPDCCSNICSNDHHVCIPCATYNTPCTHSDYCCRGLYCHLGICDYKD